MDSRPIVIRQHMLTHTITADGAMSVSADVPFWRNAQELHDYCKANSVRAAILLDGHDLDADWWTMAEPGRCHATRPQGAKFDTVGRLLPHYLSKAPVWAYNVARDSRWAALADQSDPLAVWAAATGLERALNRNLSYSPGAMVLSLLTQSRLKNPDWYDCTAPRLPRLLGGDAHHIAPGNLAAGYDWLHVYDVNAAHLAAAQSVKLGCGTVAHLTSDPGRNPGVYNCVITDRRLAPPYMRKNGYYDAALAFHAERAGGVQITDAYTYPLYHQSLRRWAESVWAAREKATGAAKSLVKAGYTQALGRMGHRPAEGYTDKEYRPLWYHAIVSEAARRQWQRWHVTEQSEGVAPLFLWSDTIGVLTRNPIAPRSSDTLGGLRHEGSYHLPDHTELYKLCASGKLIKALQYMGRQEAEGATDGNE